MCRLKKRSRSRIHLVKGTVRRITVADGNREEVQDREQRGWLLR